MNLFLFVARTNVGLILALLFASNERALRDPTGLFIGEHRLEMRQLLKNERFPNIVITLNGTVLAAWENKLVRALHR